MGSACSAPRPQPSESKILILSCWRVSQPRASNRAPFTNSASCSSWLIPLSVASALATDTPQNPAHLATQPLRFEKDGDAFIARGAGFSFRLLPGCVEMTAGGSVTASLPGASPVRPEGFDSQGVANYFRGNSPEQWRTGIPVFAKVRYRSVYPGI